MREAVIVASKRTGLAKSYRGSFNNTRPDEMASHCIKSALAQVPQLDAKEIEDCILGCGFPEGYQGMNVSRVAVLGAGLPETVAATTVNRFCSSGLQAIAMAAHQIVAEGANAAIGGGVESITLGQGKMNADGIVSGHVMETWPGVYMGMGETAEVVAERYNVTRADQDKFALMSQQRTGAAQKGGIFADEMAPMMAKWSKKGDDGNMVIEDKLVDRDECNRPSTTLDGLASLPPSFRPTGTVTAGNASQLSDGASVTVLMSGERAKELGIKPLGIYRGFAVAGCRPEEMGIGPIYAVPKLLKRAGLKMSDISVVELNEAFAAQLLYCQRQLGISDEQINPNGGAISIGHPYGMTGSRMTGHLLYQLRRSGGRYGIVTMCIGGGQGMAALFEAC
ncbi:MAG: thiolase family protein [Deltaproteobacteria bacterium]|nr:thiolase family protein [Deltaproteobacteria bacterium]